tara:strand:- start:4 stop:771 length:768 start_codon:yes stop_codon:yes gene_type:complete
MTIDIGSKFMMLINIILLFLMTITGQVAYGDFNVGHEPVKFSVSADSGSVSTTGDIYMEGGIVVGRDVGGSYAYELRPDGAIHAKSAVIIGEEGTEITFSANNRDLTISSKYSAHNVNISWDTSNNSWTTVSDRRLKTDIINETNVLPRIMAVPLRNYSWKSEGDINIRTIGFIAQEVQPHFPHLVGAAQFNEDDPTYLTLAKGLGDLAFAGVRELKLEKDRDVARLTNEIERLKTMINHMQALNKPRVLKVSDE